MFLLCTCDVELRLKGISRSQRSIVASVPITREAARDGMETFLGEIYSAISICSMSYDSDAGRGNAVDPSTTNLYTLAGSAEHFVTISMAMVDAEIARRAARPGTTIETVGDMVYGQTHRVMSLLESMHIFSFLLLFHHLFFFILLLVILFFFLSYLLSSSTIFTANLIFLIKHSLCQLYHHACHSHGKSVRVRGGVGSLRPGSSCAPGGSGLPGKCFGG